MPKDVTDRLLQAYPRDPEFRRHAAGAPRRDVQSGKLKIVEAGDGSLHPIESRHVAPEVHSLMKVDRPVVKAADLDRVVLLVNEPLSILRTRSPWAFAYLRYGRTATFASKKSKSVPVPKRSTCAARDPWYDLTELVRPGIAFWPMAQQYRHIIAANPEKLICNHNLFDLAADELSAKEKTALVAILNSTIVGLFKTLYGRYAGTEGNLKTEVVDVNLLDVPDPRGISRELSVTLNDALKRMCRREVGRLVEEQLMDCHSPERARHIADGPVVLSDELRQQDRRDLDDAALELLGVADARERREIIDRLYEATARHFREIRVVELEKNRQKAKTNSQRFAVNDLAADIWDAAELADAVPLKTWLEQREGAQCQLDIPEERPVRPPNNPMFEPTTVYFGNSGQTFVECSSESQAKLVAEVADLGLVGEIQIPVDPPVCISTSNHLTERIETARTRFRELAESRTGDVRVQRELLEVLERWFVLGRVTQIAVQPDAGGEEADGG